MSMPYPFSILTDKENEQLKLAISKITVLIAGADGYIDIDETAWAAKLAKIRTYNSVDLLQPFYEAVAQDYDERVNLLIKELPDDAEERNKILSEELSKLNDILAKLPADAGSRYYRDFVSFAHHVAKASGGFLGFFQIGPEEKRWMDLPMIEPIHFQEES